MENQKKITRFLLILILLVSCANEPISEEGHIDSNDEPSFSIKQYLGCIENNGPERVFQVRSIFSTATEVKGYFSIKDNVAKFYSIINLQGDTLKVHNTIDPKTFIVVGLNEKEKKKIRNPYFLDGRMQCYYSDRFNFYAYLDQNSPEFLLLGKTSEVELIGGNYVKVGNQVLSKGIVIDSADIDSFHTMEVWQDGTEWDRTIGLDDRYVYVNEKILTKKRFEKLIANDSLKRIYFPE